MAAIEPRSGNPALWQPAKVDPKWQDRVRRASQAREQGQVLRQGKPKSFRRTVGRAE